MTLEHLDTIISFVVIITGVSLVITTLTQMVSALLSLRGSNLRWGVQTLLKELDPNLEAHARAIAEKVLHHPLISDSTLSKFGGWINRRWRLASTVRKDELIKILRILGSQTETQKPGKTEEPWRGALAQSLQVLDTGAVENIQRAAPAIKDLLPGDSAQANEIIDQVASTAEHLSGSISQWFDSIMDRVSQRFAVQTRIWTVLFALVIALGLHLDTFRLITQLSADADLRGRLVASSDALLKKADEILVSSGGSPAVYVTAMKQLVGDHPDDLKGFPTPSGFVDLNGGKEWLVKQLPAERIADTTKWFREYQSLVPQAGLRSAADEFHSILNKKLEFQLIPKPYPQPFYNYWTPSWFHLVGILVTAVLLSLGAPFWFNILKTLTNLRPILARKEQKEAEASEK
jgi:hypothetical protein